MATSKRKSIEDMDPQDYFAKLLTGAKIVKAERQKYYKGDLHLTVEAASGMRAKVIISAEGDDMSHVTIEERAP